MNALSQVEMYKQEMRGSKYRDLDGILGRSGIDPLLGEVASEVARRSADSGRPIYSGGSCIEVNIIPGRGATEVTPHLIVYCGDGDQLHSRFLDMIQYLYPRIDTVREVVVITRKWDSKTYLKVEENLFDLVTRCGLKMVFLMETDYGFTRIPIAYMR